MNRHKSRLEWSGSRPLRLAGANLSGANLQGRDLSHSNLVGAFLREANFQGANLTGVNFENADLLLSDSHWRLFRQDSSCCWN